MSKSGTLTYQLMGELSDIGFTACLGAGGDPIVGTTLQEALEVFEADEDTRAVVMIGEIGGTAEQEAAAWAATHMTKPIVAYIAGVHRARRQADGPCRRHRLRRQGHGAGQEGSP